MITRKYKNNFCSSSYCYYHCYYCCCHWCFCECNQTRNETTWFVNKLSIVVPLQSLKFQILRLFRGKVSLTFRQLQSVDSVFSKYTVHTFFVFIYNQARLEKIWLLMSITKFPFCNFFLRWKLLSNMNI